MNTHTLTMLSLCPLSRYFLWGIVRRESGWRWGWRVVMWRCSTSPSQTSTSSTSTRAVCFPSSLLPVVRPCHQSSGWRAQDLCMGASQMAPYSLCSALLLTMLNRALGAIWDAYYVFVSCVLYCTWFTVPVKSLDTPTHSRVFLYFYYFSHCRIIAMTSKLWNNTYGIMQ